MDVKLVDRIGKQLWNYATIDEPMGRETLDEIGSIATELLNELTFVTRDIEVRTVATRLNTLINTCMLLIDGAEGATFRMGTDWDKL